jgi:acylphosphatase
VENERVRRRVVVHGRVQGVFFRDTARERARAHGVSGWVTNRGDGAVEAVLEGPPEAVERVVRFFRTGPPRAEVEDVEVVDEAPEGLSGFEVR